jgi:hypothetical protein
VDLAQIFSLSPVHDAEDRLPPERCAQLYDVLCQSGIKVCRDSHSIERLRDMRALYEGYATALSGYLCMPLPPWIADRPHKDNWQTVANVRAQSEAANPASDMGTSSQLEVLPMDTLLDDRHDF